MKALFVVVVVVATVAACDDSFYLDTPAPPPSVTFSGDNDTGYFWTADGECRVVVDGVDMAPCNPAGLDLAFCICPAVEVER